MGRLSGITIRVHLLFPVVILALVLRTAYNNPIEGAWIDMVIVMALLFGSVLLHELGHCYGARSVEGDATEVLLWPLGGLAFVEVPQTPRAHLITAAAGPAVDLIICLICMLLLLGTGEGMLQPLWNPLAYVLRDHRGQLDLYPWGAHDPVHVSTYSLAATLARLFWVNFILSLLNVCLIGYPLDGGRIFQAILWPYLGYRQATLWAVTFGFATMFLVGVAGIVFNDMLTLCLAVFIYAACKHQWLLLENGGDESLFGYDFSQGYTSLERDQPADEPPPRRRKLSWWQRWLQKRAARKIQREMEDRETAERRFDALLEKISTQGMNALTEEEKRFMKQYSDRYRNRP